MESKAILGLIERLCVGGWQANELDFKIWNPTDAAAVQG